MNYIIHENSEDISLYFFRLSRPDSIRPSHEDNLKMYGTYTHPVDNRVAFSFDIDFPVLVHHAMDGVDADELTTAIGLNNGQANSFNNKLQSTIINQSGEEHASGWELGRCRKRAPKVGKGWPVVYPADWCGDHKLS